ncbi:alpha-ketoacid dehydrogenase subunit alpha/beta [Gracilimonas mengyeensis]|uniref:3-methyl-2-oxobutanoate dehydrogenase (2-methylpropanoyl-transferring) n=1 Tax=Gracilimonas mengyeensis TaxID=1302730 RepID=A0A521F781_9BACT|nr:alpha-ketoacid dehydrogenase subunit alpha/beta [Gracilimonas mengyeensis]SMO91380.1 Pyruvate/2-oxoglutarate/acetoin dehydrogenase complex, dehydrogenase (E1) component [Gracilimonas mengyeensis]
MAQVKEKKKKSRFSAAQKKEILADFKLGWVSRYISLIGRKEVLTGKAKFGIFGDGKEIPQIAMAKQFQNGDFRSGYYRDQTFMLAIGGITPQQLFAQLYAHTDLEAEPNSGGRQMNSHFATRLVDNEGNWITQTESKNTASDISPTAGQMARLLGLAQASKVYRNEEALKAKDWEKFSKNGNEIAFGTIGDASTSEGVFWETINAGGVLQVPMVVSVWDDGYGISVAKKYQTTKESISDVLSGFQRTDEQDGYEILKVRAWDYTGLIETYEKAAKIAREEHVPVLIHVTEVTQPQGHSTSGSHERYKPEERLKWEEEYCCLAKFREWILKNKISDEETLSKLESEAHDEVNDAKNRAWKAFTDPIKKEKKKVIKLINTLRDESGVEEVGKYAQKIKNYPNAIRKDILGAARKALVATAGTESAARNEVLEYIKESEAENRERYSSHLYSETPKSPLNIEEIKPQYDEDAKRVDGRLVIRDNFDALFKKYPNTLIFGEDSGQLGDVNKGLEGMQEKYGEIRISDTGIREATILGQGIGMAMRGLRPIAEIQYLDYLLYCFQGISDDLATLRYRTRGGQASPLIVRTRGHRLEGIWHSGSPMGMILGGARGVHLCVPRNLTEAAGFYNTLLQGDDPAIIIEPLNGYRLKEDMPSNLGEFTTPLGVPEIVEEGSDITIVSYGSTFNIAHKVVHELSDHDISAELIDVRTLMPFDLDHVIGKSVEKTNRLLVVDEDVPGGASAYILNKVLQEQSGYFKLDSAPKCLSANNHRPAYASDGDYFSKPNAEDIFETVYGMMSEVNPDKYPPIY